MLNTEGADKNWTGEATWRWTMDNHWLHGQMSAKSANAEFQAGGVWGWHPKKRQYVWWMFNNWGYPQEGTATYCQESKTWWMKYVSVLVAIEVAGRTLGLDGTTSYGYYQMKAVDDNTLEWEMVEWADVLHLAKKLEMTGTYKRKS